ncbi:MAG: NIPSNAP family protein [Pseudomonadota bacterium]
MAIYELRTYTLRVGAMAEAVGYYETLGWPALSKLEDGRLIGYFTGDIGAMNQIVHLWRFEDDADRRAFWARVFADEGFMAFAAKFRPLVLDQQNKLLMNAPWGPTPGG